MSLLKKLSGNAYDWLNDYYPITPNIINRYTSNNSNSSSSSVNYNSSKTTRRYIAIRIQIDQIPNDPYLTRVFRIAIRNSNVDHMEVFGGGCKGLEQIFDYTQWLTSHQLYRYLLFLFFNISPLEIELPCIRHMKVPQNDKTKGICYSLAECSFHLYIACLIIILAG